MEKTDFYISKARKVHGDFYDYSLFEYKAYHEKVKIVCPIHGLFEQTVANHLSGFSCYLCSKDRSGMKHRSSQESFVEKSTVVHQNKYDYSKVLYRDTNTKVIIVCPVHGDFHQDPKSHLRGIGCPKCRSSKGELRIRHFFNKYNICYTEQYRIKDCRNKRPLPFDFAVFEDEEKTKLKCLVEFDGGQHTKPVQHFGGEKKFTMLKKHDNIKNNFCKEKSIQLVRIPQIAFDNIENILKTVLTIS